jgi:hypothetical protein
MGIIESKPWETGIEKEELVDLGSIRIKPSLCANLLTKFVTKLETVNFQRRSHRCVASLETHERLAKDDGSKIKDDSCPAKGEHLVLYFSLPPSPSLSGVAYGANRCHIAERNIVTYTARTTGI